MEGGRKGWRERGRDGGMKERIYTMYAQAVSYVEGITSMYNYVLASLSAETLYS